MIPIIINLSNHSNHIGEGETQDGVITTLPQSLKSQAYHGSPRSSSPIHQSSLRASTLMEDDVSLLSKPRDLVRIMSEESTEVDDPRPGTGINDEVVEQVLAEKRIHMVRQLTLDDEQTTSKDVFADSDEGDHKDNLTPKKSDDGEESVSLLELATQQSPMKTESIDSLSQEDIINQAFKSSESQEIVEERLSEGKTRKDSERQMVRQVAMEDQVTTKVDVHVDDETDVFTSGENSADIPDVARLASRTRSEDIPESAKIFSQNKTIAWGLQRQQTPDSPDSAETPHDSSPSEQWQAPEVPKVRVLHSSVSNVGLDEKRGDIDVERDDIDEYLGILSANLRQCSAPNLKEYEAQEASEDPVSSASNTPTEIQSDQTLKSEYGQKTSEESQTTLEAKYLDPQAKKLVEDFSAAQLQPASIPEVNTSGLIDDTTSSEKAEVIIDSSAKSQKPDSQKTRSTSVEDSDDPSLVERIKSFFKGEKDESPGAKGASEQSLPREGAKGAKGDTKGSTRDDTKGDMKSDAKEGAREGRPTMMAVKSSVDNIVVTDVELIEGETREVKEDTSKKDSVTSSVIYTMQSSVESMFSVGGSDTERTMKDEERAKDDSKEKDSSRSSVLYSMQSSVDSMFSLDKKNEEKIPEDKMAGKDTKEVPEKTSKSPSILHTMRSNIDTIFSSDSSDKNVTSKDKKETEDSPKKAEKSPSVLYTMQSSIDSMFSLDSGAKERTTKDEKKEESDNKARATQDEKERDGKERGSVLIAMREGMDNLLPGKGTGSKDKDEDTNLKKKQEDVKSKEEKESVGDKIKATTQKVFRIPSRERRKEGEKDENEKKDIKEDATVKEGDSVSVTDKARIMPTDGREIEEKERDETEGKDRKEVTKPRENKEGKSVGGKIKAKAQKIFKLPTKREKSEEPDTGQGTEQRKEDKDKLASKKSDGDDDDSVSLLELATQQSPLKSESIDSLSQEDVINQAFKSFDSQDIVEKPVKTKIKHSPTVEEIIVVETIKPTESQAVYVSKKPSEASDLKTSESSSELDDERKIASDPYFIAASDDSTSSGNTKATSVESDEYFTANDVPSGDELGIQRSAVKRKELSPANSDSSPEQGDFHRCGLQRSNAIRIKKQKVSGKTQLESNLEPQLQLTTSTVRPGNPEHDSENLPGSPLYQSGYIADEYVPWYRRVYDGVSVMLAWKAYDREEEEALENQNREKETREEISEEQRRQDALIDVLKKNQRSKSLLNAHALDEVDQSTQIQQQLCKF